MANEPVQFTRNSAERIADVVRAVLNHPEFSKLIRSKKKTPTNLEAGTADGQVLTWNETDKIWEWAEGAGINHRFTPSSNGSDIDVSAGDWHVWKNGTADLVKISSAGASSIGSAAATFIVASLDDYTTPTTLTIAAQAAAPTQEQLKFEKRIICQLTYTDGSISSIRRYQFGDIIDPIPRPPSSPCVLVHDATNGTRWQVVDSQYKGVFRITGNVIDDDYVRFKA